MKEKLFSLNKKDFTIQTFQSGGKGGQHQNKTDSGVRIIHNDSGAVGESRNFKSQLQNKKTAFKRLTDTPKFKLWVNKRVYELTIKDDFKEYIEADTKPWNIKTEINENGKWVQTKEFDYTGK